LIFDLGPQTPKLWHSTKLFSLIFDLGPQTPKIDSPKFAKKSPISWLVWQIDRRCLHLLGGFWGWPIQWNHVKCCGADPCCHGNDIWPRRGDIVAYWLVISSCVSYVICHFSVCILSVGQNVILLL